MEIESRCHNSHQLSSCSQKNQFNGRIFVLQNLSGMTVKRSLATHIQYVMSQPHPAKGLVCQKCNSPQLFDDRRSFRSRRGPDAVGRSDRFRLVGNATETCRHYPIFSSENLRSNSSRSSRHLHSFSNHSLDACEVFSLSLSALRSIAALTRSISWINLEHCPIKLHRNRMRRSSSCTLGA